MMERIRLVIAEEEEKSLNSDTVEMKLYTYENDFFLYSLRQTSFPHE